MSRIALYSVGILAILALFAPAAAAQQGGEHVLQYQAFVQTHSSATGEVPETPVQVTKPHTWGHLNGSSILEIRANYLVSSGGAVSPSADFRVLWDGVPVDSCEWVVEGGTITGGRFNPTVSIFCELSAFAENGTHTIEVERTDVTGTPIEESVTSIVLHQRETVHMDINLATAFDALIPVFWLSVVWFSVWRMSVAGPRYLGLLLFSLLGFVDSVLPTEVPELRLAALWGMALAVVAIALADKFGAPRMVKP